MSYYHFNRKEILQKAKERYSKEKAAEKKLFFSEITFLKFSLIVP